MYRSITWDKFVVIYKKKEIWGKKRKNWKTHRKRWAILPRGKDSQASSWSFFILRLRAVHDPPRCVVRWSRWKIQNPACPRVCALARAFVRPLASHTIQNTHAHTRNTGVHARRRTRRRYTHAHAFTPQLCRHPPTTRRYSLSLSFLFFS